jgi:CitMHS family citrate-Mg2+:H+ or citrate-Ca2+:H+ symporter
LIAGNQAMLAATAFAMIATFMVLIMTGRVSAMIALILVPIGFALLAGFGGGIGKMMVDGVAAIAPTGVMLIFAILYFGIMIDVGLFDPLIGAIVRIVRGDPVRILIGTAVLAMTVSLDGDGSTTYMITTAAMIPLYRQLKMDMRKMACVIVMASGVMNILPWGGPTARAMSALHLDAETLFVPLVPAMVATAAWVVFVAWRLGLGERARLAGLPAGAVVAAVDAVTGVEAPNHGQRPNLRWFNLLLTAALMVALVTGILPLLVLFMIGFAIAMTVNYPGLAAQRERVAAHAANALPVAGMIFAAGIFTGILNGTGMIGAMAANVTGIIPPPLAPYLAPITAAISGPFSYFISNDAFYYGVLPILAETASHQGLSAAQIARASLVGQQVHLLSPLVPSTYLLVGLAGIEFGDLTRIALKWALGACLVFLVAAILTGAVPFVAAVS